jgi:hypothetical protein
MAMPPPRSSRPRATPPRWLVVPFIITVIALLVDASAHSHSPTAGEALTNDAWADKILPYITASNEQGGEVARLTTSPLPASPKAAADELEAVAAAAQRTYRSVVAADPPQEVTSAAGLLQACLEAREQGAAQMARAAEDLVRGGSVASAVAAMSAAVGDFQVSDRAYQLFVQATRAVAPMPPSRWVNLGSYQPASLLAFARRLQSSVGKAPSLAVALEAVYTNPPPLSLQGKVEVLSPASSFSVTAVVANVGTSVLTGTAVTVSVSPAKEATSQQATVKVNLAPGQARAVTLAGFVPPASTAVTVTVAAVLPGSSQPSASKQFLVELPGPNFPGTSASSTTSSRAATASSTTTTRASSALTSTASTT